jgi:hypothetical protein
MFGASPLRSAPNQYSSAKARRVQTAMSQDSARGAVSAIVARLQGEKLWSERLLDTDSHTSTKSPHNPRSRPRRPVTRTAPIGAIQYQAAARSRAGGVELGVESLATSTTGRAVLAVVRCRETPKAESAYRHGVVRVRWRPHPERGRRYGASGWQTVQISTIGHFPTVYVLLCLQKKCRMTSTRSFPFR